MYIQETVSIINNQIINRRHTLRWTGNDLEWYGNNEHINKLINSTYIHNNSTWKFLAFFRVHSRPSHTGLKDTKLRRPLHYFIFLLCTSLMPRIKILAKKWGFMSLLSLELVQDLTKELVVTISVGKRKVDSLFCQLTKQHSNTVNISWQT